MGLFTNRKRNDDEADLVDPSRAFGAPSDDAADESMPEGATPEASAPIADTAEPTRDAVEPIADTAAPIAEIDGPIMGIAEPIADIAQPVAEIDSDVPPMPQRRLADRPKAQAGNVEIDAEGLLALLGLDADAALIDVSDAHRRFVAEHAPSAGDDEEAAEIKERIRREVKSAYASFRLTRVE